MFQFHPHHPYLGLLLLLAPACGGEQTGGARVTDGGARTESAEAGASTATSDEPSSDPAGATPSRGTEISDGDTASSAAPASSAPASGPAPSTGSERPSSESSSSEARSSDWPSSTSWGGATSSTAPELSTEPEGTTETRTGDTSSLPPVGATSEPDDASVTSVVDGGAPGVVFEDDFDGETLANGKYEFNYAAFDRWNVIGGTVDLIAFPNELLESPGGYGAGEPASGVTVDLNGSNLHDGVLETKEAFTFHAGITYEIRYSLGSPYSETNGVRVEALGVFSTEESQAGIAPFDAYSVTFTPDTTSAAKLRFTSLGNNDNVGLVLDHVALERLP